MKKIEFIKIIDYAIINNQPIGVIYNSDEIIINPVKNLKNKRDYYMAAYDEECRLINKKDIIINDIIREYDNLTRVLQQKIGR